MVLRKEKRVGEIGASTIMVVEDNEDVRFMLKVALEFRGYRVIEAANGWDAVGLVIRNRPDLILMDLRLPVLDGVSPERARGV
jgi:CheY-like chemotaxis protein